MTVIDAFQRRDFEQLVLCRDPRSGLDSVIAVHDTSLGPSLGGIRMRRYPDRDAAIADAMDLAEAMTYKAALAGLPLGGGKSVIRAAVGGVGGIGSASMLSSSRVGTGGVARCFAVAGGPPTEYVFTGPDGRPWRPATLTHRFRRLNALAGLRRCCFHDLRLPFDMHDHRRHILPLLPGVGR